MPSLGPPFDLSWYQSANASRQRSPYELMVTSPYGRRSVASNPNASGNHTGVDLRARTGTVAVAPAAGTVGRAGTLDGMCGSGVVIEHGGGWKTGFCHLSEVNVKAGDRVSKGQRIGKTGGGINDPGRGNSRASHLHFIVYKDGKQIDPMKDINWYPFALSYADTSKDPEGASGFQRRLARRSTGQVKVAGFRLPWWGWVLFGLAVIVPLGAGLVAKRRQTRWKRIARGEP
jgi:hypothetical protein